MTEWKNLIKIALIGMISLFTIMTRNVSGKNVKKLTIATFITIFIYINITIGNKVMGI